MELNNLKIMNGFLIRLLLLRIGRFLYNILFIIGDILLYFYI